MSQGILNLQCGSLTLSGKNEKTKRKTEQIPGLGGSYKKIKSGSRKVPPKKNLSAADLEINFK